MTLDEITALQGAVAKLPEVGSVVQRQAARLAERAAHIAVQMRILNDDANEFLQEVRELWDVNEREGSGL